jgi:hypothetical protein
MKALTSMVVEAGAALLVASPVELCVVAACAALASYLCCCC